MSASKDIIKRLQRMDAPHPGKTPAQRRVLDAIGCGNHSPIMSKATRDKLLRDGLIIELDPYEDNLNGMRFVMRRFEMPTPVHIQWCKAMSAECGDAQ